MSTKDYPRRARSHDNFKTDDWLMELFRGWYDPCPLDPNYTIDGLAMDWIGHVFVNPPYSKPLPWVKKAIEESKNGCVIALLLKHDSSTEWYRLLHEAGWHMMMINGRLKHGTGKGAAFPSVLFVSP